MAEVVGLAGTITTRQGYRVTTETRGDDYVTVLRRCEEDGEHPTVEVEERYRVDGDTGDREDLAPIATDAVREAIESRGVRVA